MADAPGKFVVRPAVQLSTRNGLTDPTPLFEEKWHTGAPALISHGNYPFLFHGSRAWTTFSAHNYPMDSSQVQFPSVFQQRFNREKTDRGIGILQIFDARDTVLPIFDAHSPPNMRLFSGEA